ncbi:hypothetical protein FHX06_003486 [Rhizobium sp. BK512]|nr:hypothetical protein [Rhizobium sp. BK512]
MDDAIAIGADPTDAGSAFRSGDDRAFRHTGDPDIRRQAFSMHGPMATGVRAKARGYHRPSPGLCRDIRQDRSQSLRETAGTNADGLNRIGNAQFVFWKIVGLPSAILTDGGGC